MSPPRPRFILLLLVLVLLAACADGEESRRFATDPVPSSVAQATPVVAPTSAAGLQRPTIPATPPAALLNARGAPRRIYFRSGAELWTVAPLVEAERRLVDPGPDEIRAFAASPSGDRVALLLTRPTGDGAAPAETVSLRLLAADGHELRRVDRLEAVLGAAEAAVARAGSLSWSPQGDQLLVAFATGGVVVVPHDREPRLLLGQDQAAAPGAAAWSPAGDAVAFTDPVNPGATTRLLVRKGAFASSSPHPLPTSTGSANRSVTAMAWLPNGRGLLFAETAAPGSPATGGDLLAVEPDGKGLRLVASTGFAAPIAEVGRFAPSPDGRAVVYSVLLPAARGDRTGSTFHSLWVRSLDGGTAGQLPVPRGAAVTDLWWTAAGVVVRLAPETGNAAAGYRDGPFALHLYGADGRVVELFVAVPADGATPVGSPPASPSALTVPPRFGPATPEGN